MVKRVIHLFLACALIFAPVAGSAGSEDFLSKNDRRMVQRSLTQSGFDAGAPDGVFGKGTRSAIRDWQIFNGYRATGMLTPAQYAALTGDGTSALILANSGDGQAWRDSQAANTTRAYRNYIARYPGGAHVREAQERLERKALVAERRDREKALGLSRNQRREVEQLLARTGYYPGSINGKFDRDTRRAIRDYRRDRGIESHAFLDRRMLRYLVEDGGGHRQRQNGEDNTGVAIGFAAGALLLGGIILLAD